MTRSGCRALRQRRYAITAPAEHRPSARRAVPAVSVRAGWPGYEDVNDADRLALDPVMRQVVGGRAVDTQAASASQMGRFETETLALAENRAALADLNGQWIDRFHDRNGLKYIVLDMDSSVSPTHGDQEGSAWNGHFDCTCYHPNFLFNQFGMLERCALRNGNVHSADGWRDVLDPVIARYAGRDLGGRLFRADAAYAIPAIYARLEAAGYFYAIRLPANAVLKEKIADRLTRPVGRPSLTRIKRFYEDFEYQAASWDKPRRVIAKIEWHPGELFPRVGFIITNLPMEPDWVVRFYNQRGTAEQHIKEGKYAFHWTRLSCKRFRDNEVRLQLHALAYNLATFMRCIELPEAMANWSLTSLQLKLIKDGGPRRASRPRHHLPACRGGGHRPHGQGHPHCDPPPSSTSVMCVTAILTETERKRQDSSVHRAEERRCWARMMRVCGPTCPHSNVLAHANAAQGPKRLIGKRI